MGVASGAKHHSDRLKRMKNTRDVVKVLYASGLQVQEEARRLIFEGAVSGKNHVPSLPGQAPNNDTGFLASNITTHIVAQNPPTVHVTSHAPYSAVLEFGGSKMAERPYMRPAVAKFRGKIPAEISVAIKKITR